MILIQRLQAGYSWLTSKANMLEPFALLIARLAVARVFFMSGLTKWNGFLSFNPDKYDLFLFEFFCPEDKRAGALVLCTDQAAGTYAPTTQWIVERFANMAGTTGDDHKQDGRPPDVTTPPAIGIREDKAFDHQGHREQSGGRQS